MTSVTLPAAAPVSTREDTSQISRVPYLAGLDGFRALAVIAVMVYHANSSWLSGGFLGVEMFFVISGYLITLLIVAERERSYRVSLFGFWMRRARRLLPALLLMMLLVIAYTVFFEPSAVGQLRGDVIAGLGFSSNWYQLYVGLDYTAAFDFAPLRHLWSLAVEEQFYLVWPVVMVLLLGRRGTRRIADVSRWLMITAFGITVVMALLYHPGVIGEPNVTPEAYWHVAGRTISKVDFSYVGTVTRLPGILLGAAFAMLWRPFAIMRGPLRTKGPVFDVVALVAIAVLGWMCVNLYLVAPNGAADARLFRGGLLVVSIATIAVIAAVSHPGAKANRVLGNPVFVWIGVRSYGLYLFHWPIYQAIRKLAGNRLTVMQFAVAMVLTLVITELSYRFVETPIRAGRVGPLVGRERRVDRPTSRRLLVIGGAFAAGVSLFATASLATAQLQPNEIAEELDRNADSVTNLADADASIPDLGELGGRPSPTIEPSPSTEPVPDSTTAPVDTTDTFTPTTEPGLPPVEGPITGTPELADRIALGDRPEPDDPDDPNPPIEPTPAPPDEPTEPDPEPEPTPPPPRLSLGVVTTLDGLVPLDVADAGPPPSIRLIGFGDSVMRGSAEELTSRGFVVDASTSRQFTAALPELLAIRDNGFLGAAVVVHLGTNGSFSQGSLEEMMTILAEVPTVVFVTGKADRGWIAGNNEMLRALPARYANVTVIDWEVLGPMCPGDCFYSDNIHLNAAGQNYYADIVARVLGLV